MVSPERSKKINSLLQEELNRIFLKDLDFENALVTITRVEVNSDLSQAKVYFVVNPDEREEEARGVMEENISHIQNKLRERLKMRPVPKIKFEIDRGAKNLYRIDELSKEDKQF